MDAPNPPSSSSPAPCPGRRAGARRWLTGIPAVILVLAVFWLGLTASLWNHSMVVDELVHATAGFSYWRFNDYRVQPENGVLPQRLFGIPLVLAGHRFPAAESAVWQRSSQWQLGQVWFYEMGNDAVRMLREGRSVAALLAVALGALVWWWARSLYGAAGGMLALLLYVLSPTILAYGGLMTSDLAAGFGFFAATLGIWALLHRITASRLLGCSLGISVLVLSKMSAALIVPIALILVAIRIACGRPLPVALGRPRLLTRRPRMALALAAAFLVQAAAVWAAIWAAYGFRYSLKGDAPLARSWVTPWEYVLERPPPAALLGRIGLSPERQIEIAKDWQARDVPFLRWTHASVDALQELKQTSLTPEQARRLDEFLAARPESAVPRFLDFCRRHRLFPEAYIYGFAYTWTSAHERLAFLNGEVRVTGWRWFFPYTFAVKTPLPLFAVAALAVAAAIAGWRRRPMPATVWRSLYRTLPLWVLFAVYWAAAIPSHLNIGHRHILVVYPPLFVLCSAAAGWFDRTRRAGGPRAPAVALCLLLAALVAETAARFPNYIAYFNGIVSPSHAYRHLVDSSLDWGQDLPAAGAYLAAHPAPRPAYLAYFGIASPACYGISARCINPLPGNPASTAPAVQVVPLAPTTDRRAFEEKLRRFPDHEYVGTANSPDGTAAILFKRPEAIRLGAGAYLVSATLLQPVCYADGPWGPWSDEYENTYQQLYREMKPLISDDPEVRREARRRLQPIDWHKLLALFEQYRFARLTAWLRGREPDDSINYSILVFRLTEAELAQALDGPKPRG